MEAQRREPGDEETLKTFRRGWYVGSEAFRQEQLARIEGKLGRHHAGALRRETAEAKGGRIVAEELLRLGWSESELMLRRKNDPDKMGMAVRLRRETTLSIKDIAARVLKHGERAFTSRDERSRVGRFEPKVRSNMN